MAHQSVAIIGAGIGGLSCAIDLAARGVPVDVYERAPTPGGKLRQIDSGGRLIDAGPTVFTLPQVFEQLFSDAGDDFHRRVSLIPADLIARHGWEDGRRLDLFSDSAKSAQAITDFAGAADGAAYLKFAHDARRIYDTLERPFMRMQRPSLLSLMSRVGVGGLGDLARIDPFRTLWHATARYFRNPRLRQLFSRYATYCGSSPFLAPATLMLISHVERAGVYYLEGGMFELARQLHALAVRQGVRFHFGAEITRIVQRAGRVVALEARSGERKDVSAVVCNADSNAVASGALGSDIRRAVRPTPPAARSLSAVTVTLAGRTSGFEISHHTVFFPADYRAEFESVFKRHRLPARPTVYVCAQDRHDAALPVGHADERLLCLINAPAIGDRHRWTYEETRQCETLILDSLRRFGLTIEQTGSCITTTPSDFDRLFPATGGALYGPASHGWRASFKRTGSRTAMAGLYLAGGSVHPGAGVPMAALSGRLAATSVMQDFASTSQWIPAGMPGGTSTA